MLERRRESNYYHYYTLVLIRPEAFLVLMKKTAQLRQLN